VGSKGGGAGWLATESRDGDADGTGGGGDGADDGGVDGADDGGVDDARGGVGSDAGDADNGTGIVDDAMAMSFSVSPSPSPCNCKQNHASGGACHKRRRIKKCKRKGETDIKAPCDRMAKQQHPCGTGSARETTSEKKRRRKFANPRGG